MASRDEVFLRSSELSAYVDNVLNESDSDSGDLDGETVNINDDNDEISDNDGRSDSSDDDDDNDNRPNLQTWTWTNDTNTVRQINFTGNSGINPIVSRQLNADCTELDVLNQFLTNEFWDKVVSETNKYAREKILGGGDVRPNNNWTDVTKDEMKAYFSLVVLMSQNPKTKSN
ncbi:putative uncharacterized protein DDB_G0287265 [Homalodisca vitripennis]|uniref:putative uncharacterized protein DDB_G0287265 n=1 Tax=Homalodisca vitripennis TaxID=197043 RepID=UPI001EEC2484|nr:putative uncharacterized protein DDB_G0287265 [Homalodisca vitripennis]